MVRRGQQSQRSQAKTVAKQAKLLKKVGDSLRDQKAGASKTIPTLCASCKAEMPDPKTYKEHFEQHHPKLPIPPQLVVVKETHSFFIKK